ncbi:hypothetical protein J4226_01255 [Candidatus Pacearchaeota archaeon]|nr:hypothetical protein [Candidatus Pacearchaeota archaeon]
MKVEFSLPNPDEHAEEISGFLNPEYGWDWGEYILGEYPELRKKLLGVSDGLEKKKIAKEYFTGYFADNINSLNEKVSSFQKSWDEIGEDFVLALEDVLEIKWNKQDRIARAYVGLNPICPRDILKRDFSVYYKKDDFEMRRTVFHEMLHFLWFDKWKTIFTDFNHNNLNEPALEWKLSEIVPLAILSDSRIQKLFEHYPSVYDEWQKIIIDDKPLLKHIQEIYDGRSDFEDFVRKSWEFVNKYQGFLDG